LLIFGIVVRDWAFIWGLMGYRCGGSLIENVVTPSSFLWWLLNCTRCDVSLFTEVVAHWFAHWSETWLFIGYRCGGSPVLDVVVRILKVN
jgi:hypothetical protein